MSFIKKLNFDSWRAGRRQRFLEFAAKRENVRKILVVRNGLLGDMVFISPVLLRLRATFPHAEIDVATSDQAVDILKNFPSLRKAYSIRSGMNLFHQMKFFYAFRQKKYDIVLTQETNSHYTFMSRLTGARWHVGFQNSADILLDYSVPWEQKLHSVRAGLETINEWTVDEISPPRTPLFISPEELHASEILLHTAGISQNDFLVCIHQGCSERNSVRQWISANYSQLADALIERYRAKIIFTGIEPDKQEIETIQRTMKHSSVNLAGKTSVRTFIGVLKKTSLVIGPDTGALHIAVALQRPTLMLMGYSDPQDTGPFDPTCSRVVRVDLPCSPCVYKTPKPLQWNICVHTRPVLCMEMLSVNQVLDAAVELVDSYAKLTIRNEV